MGRQRGGHKSRGRTESARVPTLAAPFLPDGHTQLGNQHVPGSDSFLDGKFQLSPKTGIAAPRMTLASSLHKNRMTRAMSCGFGHFKKSAFGMALRFASVPMMLGRIEFTRTPVPFKSAPRASIMATAAALEPS